MKPGRSFTKLDRYALPQIGREHRLLPGPRCVLLMLTLLADYRSQEWSGTYHELAQDTGMGRNSVTDAMKVLREARLIEEVEPFGPNRRGTVRVLAYERLVVLSSRSASTSASNSANQRVARRRARPEKGNSTTPQSSRSRVGTASSDSSRTAVTSQFSDGLGIEASRDRGGKQCTRARAENEHAEEVTRLKENLGAIIVSEQAVVPSQDSPKCLQCEGTVEPQRRSIGYCLACADCEPF
jgi:DNA-binding transcriptional ArsR family regulator